MIAYKTFSQCPESDRPPGVLLTYPWMQVSCSAEEIEYLVEQGYTIVEDADYTALVASLEVANQTQMAKAYIESKLKVYRQKAAALSLSLYSDNTLAGITAEQSNQMFDEYADVVLRLNEGAWPTAIERLNEKTPSGFVTQALIDTWKQRIMEGL